MPTYTMKCTCGHTQDIVRSIAKMDEDLPVHCDQTMRRVISAPMVRSDEQVIRSMVDGKIYTSRGRYRQHLKDNGMIEMGNDAPTKIPPLKPPPGLKETIIRQVYEKLPNH